MVLITVFCADQMRPVPDNDFDNDPAEDLAQNPQSQDGETLLSNSLLKSFSCRPSDISHIRQELADLHSRAGAMIESGVCRIRAKHMPLTEALQQGLIPQSTSIQKKYTESDKMFLELATRLNWTQAESREVLQMLKDPQFRREHLSADVLRQVRILVQLCPP